VCYYQDVNKKDWTLLAISLSREQGLSPVQIQKALFLLGKELPQAINGPFYEFVPHNYGPFSKEIYEDAEGLAEQGMVAVARRPGRGFLEYYPTSFGDHQLGELKRRADPVAVAYLEKAVNWVQSARLPA